MKVEDKLVAISQLNLVRDVKEHIKSLDAVRTFSSVKTLTTAYPFSSNSFNMLNIYLKNLLI